MKRIGGWLFNVGAALRVWLVIARNAALRASVDRLGRRGAGGDPPTIRERIAREVLAWSGVTIARHRYGGVEFRLGRRELGHLHGDYLADLPFPVRVRRDLVRDGRALPHHILPHSGWVSYPIRDERAVPGAIDLFRLAYERASAAGGGVGAAARIHGGGNETGSGVVDGDESENRIGRPSSIMRRDDPWQRTTRTRSGA